MALLTSQRLVWRAHCQSESVPQRPIPYDQSLLCLCGTWLWEYARFHLPTPDSAWFGDSAWSHIPTKKHSGPCGPRSTSELAWPLSNLQSALLFAAGLHYPDVLAPWGVAEGADGVNADAGLNSNGPFSTMPVVWEWEFGDRANLSRVKEKLFPLVKGEARPAAKQTFFNSRLALC